ncbi:MAG TPA: sulfatase-like hydrolase/transferase, partial [Thermoanaerobaculia bacterium]|nr:sulfatase-like hydrolase/transferase [Thermoanaerobaculia bacterium]
MTRLRRAEGPRPRPSTPRPSSPDPLITPTLFSHRPPPNREKREQGRNAPGVPLSRGGGWGGRERGRGEGLGRGPSKGTLHRPAGVLLLLLLLAAACRHNTAGGPVDVPKGTPVIFISIDTLRADHVPAYGYKGVETPALDAFRREGVLFERAYSTTPLTLPSHSTLLTGVLPAVHGVRDNVGYKLDAAKIKSGALPFLPEILKKAGYATGGAVSAFVLQGKSGISTGFDFYEDGIEFRSGTGLGGLQRPGSETLKLSQGWLESVKDKPFFFFFHIYEPHTPYAPPEPYASRYPSKYDGEIATADHIVGELI